MFATIWGCRGSLATPGEGTLRYGGNTSCVAVRAGDGSLIVLDAGTGIRQLGLSLLPDPPTRIDLLLTHLHLDHIEGLGFFALFFQPETTIRIYGPQPSTGSLRDTLVAYLSPPFVPFRFEELPARIEFTEVASELWSLGEVTVTAAPVCHPGGALGYRLEEAGRALAFIPDNELGLDAVAGLALASGADVLLHDAQYTAEEYRSRVGWGHSSLPDLAVFLDATNPGRALMFHHDPTHDDATLERMRDEAEELAGRPVELGAEGLELLL